MPLFSRLFPTTSVSQIGCRQLTVLVPGRAGTRDLGFVIADVLFMTRLPSQHRRPEVDAVVTLTTEMPKVAHLRSGTVEG
ncbi:hypothetical protein ACTPOK_41060 [Streptomyces inhibens]|uniref:hypothetical protein n=1 Tax=Streptomyces inhibens TaxID=2293571 RepID=UPI00402B0354